MVELGRIMAIIKLAMDTNCLHYLNRLFNDKFDIFFKLIHNELINGLFLGNDFAEVLRNNFWDKIRIINLLPQLNENSQQDSLTKDNLTNCLSTIYNIYQELFYFATNKKTENSTDPNILLFNQKRNQLGYGKKLSKKQLLKMSANLNNIIFAFSILNDDVHRHQYHKYHKYHQQCNLFLNLDIININRLDIEI